MAGVRTHALNCFFSEPMHPLTENWRPTTVIRSLHRRFDSSVPLEVPPAATPRLLVFMSWLEITMNLRPVPENVRRPEATNPSRPGGVRAD
jgi:hypothetical protein